LGSIGKNTALKFEFDFDLMIYINNISHPFDDVFNDFLNVIQMQNSFDAFILNSGKPKKAIKAMINGFNFEICLAISFHSNPIMQREAVVKQIKESDNPYINIDKYETSLGETQTLFVKRQSNFTLDLIRLTKYWCKTLFLKSHISGRLTLCELIAVKQAIDEENKYLENRSLLNAFKQFLQTISRFKHLNITFDMFYGKNSIDNYMLNTRPLVLNPINPYQNLAQIEPQIIEQFEEFADKSIDRLKCDYLGNDLNFIFEPQPIVAPQDIVYKHFPQFTNNWLVEVRDCNDVMHPNMIWRNKKLNKTGIEIIKIYLFNNIKIVNNLSRFDSNRSGIALSNEELENIVKNIIYYNIYGKVDNIQWNAKIESHINYDITFEIPSGDSLVIISLKW
jgi:hypothetical protein